MVAVFGDKNKEYASQDMYAIDADGRVYAWGNTSLNVNVGTVPKTPVHVGAFEGKYITSIFIASGQ